MRIGETAQKAVVFFGVPGPDGIQYGGTGFLAAVPEGEFNFGYLVTCRHVAKSLENYSDTGFYIRLNLRSGGSEDAPVDAVNWTYHPDPTVDLALTRFQFDIRRYEHIFYFLNETLADYRTPGMVVVGDVVNLVGLFRLHSGAKRSIPIVHTGHIAMMPNPNEPVPLRDRITKKLTHSEMYLIEAQTLDGLSGSPVFLHEMVGLSAFGPVNKEGTFAKAYGDVVFLGIYCGSWDGEPGEILAKDRSLDDRKIRVPVGMGLVAPSHKLMELLEDEKLKNARKTKAEEIRARGAAVTDSAFPAPSSSDENPTAREDFMRLANAAARKQKQDE